MCQCTAAGRAVHAPQAGTHLRTPMRTPALAPQLPSGGGAGCKSPTCSRTHPCSCWRQAAPAQPLRPGQKALVYPARAPRQRSAWKGKPDNEEFDSASLFSNRKQPSGGTKPALLYRKGKLSYRDSEKARDPDPTRSKRTAKYCSHVHLDGGRMTSPKREGSSWHLLCLTEQGHISRPPWLCSPLPAGSNGGRGEGAVRSTPRALHPNPGPRPHILTQQTPLSLPWPNSPLAMDGASVTWGQLRFH